MLLSFQRLAAEPAGINRIFSSTLWTYHYEERFCVKNIEKLVRKSIDARLPVERNWYLHALVLVNGKVRDKDFINQPTAFPLNQCMK